MSILARSAATCFDGVALTDIGCVEPWDEVEGTNVKGWRLGLYVAKPFHAR